MVKLTFLFGHPMNADDFESYYLQKHLALSAKLKGYSRLELSKCLPGLDGGKPAYHRMAELWFEDEEAMKACLASPEAQAAIADIPNFATGGVTVLVGLV